MIFQRAPQALLQTDSDATCLLRTDNTTLIAPSRPATTLLSVVVSVKTNHGCSSNTPALKVIFRRAPQALLQTYSDETCVLRTDNTTLIAPSHTAITLFSVVVSVKHVVSVHQSNLLLL